MLEKLLIKGVILFFAAVLVYIPAMDGGYIYDDDQLLYMNPIILRGNGFLDKESWRGLGSFWLPVDPRGAADYFPATSSMLWLEWRLFGNNEPDSPPAVRGGIGAPGYHIVNVVLHAGCVLLLWAVLETIAIPGAWVAAFIWGVHPVCVESVAWISELKNTLSMLIFMLMMLAWFKFQRTRRTRDYNLTIALFIIALLAKTAIVMAPFVLLLYVWWDRGLEEGKKWWSKLTVEDLLQSVPFFAISFIFGVITWYFQITRAIGQETVPIGNPLERVAGASFALGFYLYKIIFPVNLILIYPEWHVPALNFPSWQIPPLGHFLSYELLLLLPGLAYIALFFCAWRNLATWGRHVIFSFGFFVLMLFPILGLVKIAYLRLTLVADHFEYTPMVSIIALCVAGCLYHRKNLRPGLAMVFNASAVCIIALFCLLTWQRADVFHDKKELWLDTLAKNPNSWQAHSHYGAILYKEGDIHGAYENWKKCVELKPYIYEVHNNLGLALMALGHMKEALEQYKMAVDIDSTQPPVVMNYADGLRMARLYPEALEQYARLVKISPGDPRIYLDMGVAYFEMGRLDDSIAAFEQAIRIAPNWPDPRRNLDRALQVKQMELKKKQDDAHAQMQAAPAQPQIQSGVQAPQPTATPDTADVHAIQTGTHPKPGATPPKK